MAFRFGCCTNDGETLWTCVTAGNQAAVQSTTGVNYQFQLPAGAMFSYLAAQLGQFALAFEGADDQAYICDQGAKLALGAKIGNETIFIRANGDGKWTVYFEPAELYSQFKFRKLTIERTPAGFNILAAEDLPVPPQYAPPATGWCDVIGDTPLWTVIESGYQLAFTREGLAIVCPQTRNGFTSGQALRGGSGCVAIDRDGKLWRVYRQDSKVQPRIAATPGGLVVVVSPGPDSGDQIAFPGSWTPEPLIFPFSKPKLIAAYTSGTTSSANANFDNATLTRKDGSVLARWIDVSDGLRRGIQPVDSLAGHPHGSVAYNDGREFPAWAEFLSRGDRIAFPMYRNPGESLGSLAADAARFIRQAADRGLRVIIVGLAWNRLATLSDWDVDGGAAVINDTVENNDIVDGVVWFGLNRGTAQGYFKPAYQALVDSFSSPGLPAWEAPVATGSVTITSYDPKSGAAPVGTRAVAAYQGDVKFFRWRYQKDGGPWNYGPVNPVADTDNTFNFAQAGTYNIGVDGLDANQQPIPGAATGAARIIVVTQPASDVKAKLDAVQAAFDNLRQELGQ